MRNTPCNKSRRLGSWQISALCLVSLAAALTWQKTGVAAACPICGQPTITLSERYARADVALLVEWVSAKTAQGKTPESTTYEIVQVQRDSATTYKPRTRLSIERYIEGKSGNLYFLLGRKDDELGIRWDEPALPVSETSFQYVIQAPSPEAAAETRLAYFVKFLEFADLAIANDAFAEFVNAPTKDIVAIADKLPRDKLRRWLANPATPVNRQAGYGLMLGLCGGPDDARFLSQRIINADPERPFGLDGLTFGYLLLAGEEGLTMIEKSRLANPRVADGDLYPAIKAIEYYWSSGNGRIPKARLQAAMQLLLDRPALAETAITTLARWKDWSVQARLMQLYGTKDYDVESTKKVIIGYMIASTKDIPKASPANDAPVNDRDSPPRHVVVGLKNLEELRQREPKLVVEAEKFFYLK